MIDHRERITILASICLLLLGTTGCTSWELRNRRGAWETELRSITDVAYQQACKSLPLHQSGNVDYSAGWREAYYQVLRGGNGEPPVVPAESYWSPESRLPGSENRLVAWHHGYLDGRTAAMASGRQGFAVMPTIAPIDTSLQKPAIYTASHQNVGPVPTVVGTYSPMPTQHSFPSRPSPSISQIANRYPHQTRGAPPISASIPRPIHQTPPFRRDVGTHFNHLPLDPNAYRPVPTNQFASQDSREAILLSPEPHDGSQSTSPLNSTRSENAIASKDPALPLNDPMRLPVVHVAKSKDIRQAITMSGHANAKRTITNVDQALMPPSAPQFVQKSNAMVLAKTKATTHNAPLENRVLNHNDPVHQQQRPLTAYSPRESVFRMPSPARAQARSAPVPSPNMEVAFARLANAAKRMGGNSTQPIGQQIPQTHPPYQSSTPRVAMPQRNIPQRSALPVR